MDSDGAPQAISQAHTSAMPLSLDATQKALVASAAHIVAEKAAAKCTGTGPTGSGTLQEQIVLLKNENAALQNMYNPGCKG